MKSVKCCTLGYFITYDKKYTPTWKWGRLRKDTTYIIIFSRDQRKEYNAFNKVKDMVDIVFEQTNCYNAVHPGWSKNHIIVFQKKVENGTGGGV